MNRNKVYREVINGNVHNRLYSRNGIGQVNNKNLRYCEDGRSYIKEVGVIEYDLVEVARYSGEQFQSTPTRKVYSFSTCFSGEVFERAYIRDTEEAALQRFMLDVMYFYNISSDEFNTLTIDRLGGIPLGK